MTTYTRTAIRVGALFKDAITWSGAAFGFEPLVANPRVTAQMRMGPGQPLLLQLDSLNGTLVPTSTTTLEIRLTAAQTVALKPAIGAGVFFDIRRYDQLDADGVPAVMPFLIYWPVTQTISVP